MHKLLAIAAIFAIGALATALLAFLKPARFSVTRSIAINAPADSVSALIRSIDRWPEWSPPDDAKGDVRLKLVTSTPELVRVQADWKRPFVAQNFNNFQLEPTTGGVRVTWTLDGENVALLRVMTVFVSPDRVMGGHLAAGLAGLKAVAERTH